MQQPLAWFKAHLLHPQEAGGKQPRCHAGRQWNLLHSLLRRGTWAGIQHAPGIPQDLQSFRPQCLCVSSTGAVQAAKSISERFYSKLTRNQAVTTAGGCWTRWAMLWSSA